MLRDLVRTSMDYDFYITQDEGLSDLTPQQAADHYFDTGHLKSLDPARWFSTSFYLDEYPVVASTLQNPFLHYLVYGRAEGKHPNANSVIGTKPFEQFPLRAQEQQLNESRWQLFTEHHEDLRTDDSGVLFVLDDWQALDDLGANNPVTHVPRDVWAIIASADLSDAPDTFESYHPMTRTTLISAGEIRLSNGTRPRPSLVVAIGDNAARRVQVSLRSWRSTTPFAVLVRPLLTPDTADLRATAVYRRQRQAQTQLIAEFDLLIQNQERDDFLFDELVVEQAPADGFASLLDPGAGAPLLRNLGWRD